MSLYLMLVSHRQHISGSSLLLFCCCCCCFIYYGNLSFLAEAINFWKYSSLLLQAFLLFLLLVLASCVCYSVCSCLTSLRYFFCLFALQSSSFCFCLFVLEVSVYIYSNSDSSFSSVQSINKAIQTLFPSVTLFLISITFKILS